MSPAPLEPARIPKDWLGTLQAPTRAGAGKQGGPGFDDMFKGFLNDVNSLQNRSSESVKKFVAGEVKDVHQVMVAVGEAKVALNLLLEIRNKLLQAYEEVMRMRA